MAVPHVSAPGVPDTLLRNLALIPPDVHAALLLRHAHREEIEAGTYGTDVPLSAHGVGSAEALGASLGSRRIARLVSSPVGRCVDTAAAVARGAGDALSVTEDWRLGDPGPFVVDPDVAGPPFLDVGAAEVVRRQLCEPEPPPGMRATGEGVRLLLDLALGDGGGPNTLDILVTHDAVIAAFLGHILPGADGAAPWPDFLEGALLWGTQHAFGMTWNGRLPKP